MSIETANDAQAKIALLRDNLSEVIRGVPESIDLLAISLICNGSVLLEDVPGVGKTTLAKALALSIDLDFQRVQFTPDLLPSDILGASIYNPVDGKFDFRPGPIFCNVLLADEINRASPRTQSALLEAMGEGQVTIEGKRYELKQPFIVIATQNPIDFHGTYPLPEAQLDRFMIELNLGYPSAETEVEILYAQSESHPLERVKPVLSTEDVFGLQQAARDVRVDETVSQYIVKIVQQTRTDSRLKLGASPRGSLMLFQAARALALIQGRDYVLPEDVQSMTPPVLAHRLVLNSKAKYGSTTKHEVIVDILQQIAVPT